MRLRQLAGQHLITPADGRTVVRDLCGLQAQFLSNALHALSIRSTDPIPDTLVKSWTIRGTMHLFDQSDLPVMLHEGRTPFLRPRDQLISDDCVTQVRKRYFADLIVDHVAEGMESREALHRVCTEAGMTEREGESIFDPWGGTIRALCEAGILCHKVQEKKAFQLCPPFEPMEQAPAQLELARRYFTSYGPATGKDCAYFFGTTQKQVKAWLEKLPVTAQTHQGRTYYGIEDHTPEENLPACIFLAGFDPLMLGYEKKESLYLPPEYLRSIFSLAGIVSSAILLRGRVVGRWKKKNGKLQLTAFEALGEDRQIVEEAADRLWPDENLRLQWDERQ